jgi:hypothetical protein
MNSVDLRTNKEKSFICTVSLCGKPGDESIQFHNDIEAAREAKQRIDHLGCGGGCQLRHYILRIPRGHVKNMNSKPEYKRGGYIRWLVEENIVWKL